MSISKRLRDRSDHYLPDWAREVMDEAAQQIDDTAAFLDQMADRLDKPATWARPRPADAADCRAMARRLLEPVAVQAEEPAREQDQQEEPDRASD